MKLTSEQRQALIGKSFSQNRRWPTSIITIQDIERCGGGFTVKYTIGYGYELNYRGLQSFLKYYKHDLMEAMK